MPKTYKKSTLTNSYILIYLKAMVVYLTIHTPNSSINCNYIKNNIIIFVNLIIK